MEISQNVGAKSAFTPNLFFRNHTDQATIANTSSLANSLRTTLIKSEIDLSWGYGARSQEKFGNHTGWKALQLEEAWKESSGAIWHSLHNVLSNTFLFCKLTFVGRALEQARYGKIFTLFGTLRACLANHFSSLNFHHSSLITHNSSLNFSHPFGIITQFPSLNIFHTICGPIHVSRCNFFFFF